MPGSTLRFEVCWTMPYPVATTGYATALTMCLRNNDPFLAFLTQTGYEDDVVYLHIMGGEDHRHVTPVGHDTISGMAYDLFRQIIWCGQSTQDPETIISFDPDTGLLTDTRAAPLSPTLIQPQGLACNSFFFVRGGGSTLELWATSGLMLGTRDYPGRDITGLSASPWSYSFVDINNDEIVVVGPLGNEIAVSSGVGASGGMQALAFDCVNHWAMDSHPQVWLPDGTIGAVGTVNHPDTPWNPVPWGGRHRLYVANESDQLIYAGYLTQQ